MTLKTQPLERDDFIDAFKRGMETTINRLLRRIDGRDEDDSDALRGSDDKYLGDHGWVHEHGDEGDRNGPDKPPAKTTSTKRGGCVVHLELDQTAINKLDDDGIRDYLTTEAVGAIVEGIQKAKDLARTVRKSAPTLTRGGSGECHVDFDHSSHGGDHISGGCGWRF
jgi:hypothetical protein